MKIFLLTVLGFAIFAATLAATPKKKTRNVANVKEKTKSDLGIEENIEDILQDEDDNDIEDRGVEIKFFGEITATGPIALAQKIKKVSDPKKKIELIRKLKKASKDNKNSPAGIFYNAANIALRNENRARQFWKKQGDNVSKILASISDPSAIGNDFLRRGRNGSGFGINGANGTIGNVRVPKLTEADPVGAIGNGITRNGKNGFGINGADVGNGITRNGENGFGIGRNGKNGFGFGINGANGTIGNVQKLAEADPVGKLLQRGESGGLRGLSNAAQTFGSVSDSFYDGVGNVSKIVRALTFPVDGIPIANDIKNSAHNLIEGQAERAKYLAGTFADNTAAALQNAADDASQKADEKEKKLRRIISSRRTITA